MALSAPRASQLGESGDHSFHLLRIKRVVRETAEANSFVLEIPAELRDGYTYEAGQFCTFRVVVVGEQLLRSYSMSSSPAVDDELQVTVKRVPGGVVSNWMNDTLRSGDVIEATVPAGVFCLGPDEREVIAFAGGSGITPVFSILKTALATTSRRVRLLYANRDRDAVIFASELDALAERHADKLHVSHHLDVEKGFVDRDDVRAFAVDAATADVYICGPAPFMELVEQTVLADGVPAGRIHIERFTPLDEPDLEKTADEAPAAVQVTIEQNRRVVTGEYRHGTTLLQTARGFGLSPPSSCEAGNCATCMARLLEGAATMHANNALTDEEVADGWVLTCQAVPTTSVVRVVYE